MSETGLEVNYVDFGHVFERAETNADGRKLTRELWLVVNVERTQEILRNHAHADVRLEPYIVRQDRYIPLKPSRIVFRMDGHITLEKQHPHGEEREQMRFLPKDFEKFLQSRKLTPHLDKFGYPDRWRVVEGWLGMWESEITREDRGKAFVGDPNGKCRELWSQLA